MARTKKAPRTVPQPENMAGLMIAKVAKKLDGKDKPATTLEVIAPEETGAGIVAWQKWYNSVRTDKDPDANVVTARAILALCAKSQEAVAKSKDADGNRLTGFAFPRAPQTRTLDPMEGFLEAQRAFIMTYKRPPTQDETAEMYAAFFG